MQDHYYQSSAPPMDMTPYSVPLDAQIVIQFVDETVINEISVTQMGCADADAAQSDLESEYSKIESFQLVYPYSCSIVGLQVYNRQANCNFITIGILF